MAISFKGLIGKFPPNRNLVPPAIYRGLDLIYMQLRELIIALKATIQVAESNTTRIVALETPIYNTTPTFLNGWSNFNNGYQVLRATKSKDGFVNIQGLVKSTQGTTGQPSTIATFEGIFAPTAGQIITACLGEYGSYNHYRVDAYTSGGLLYIDYIGPSPVPYWISIDINYIIQV